jgi:YD repeat-containing protein
MKQAITAILIATTLAAAAVVNYSYDAGGRLVKVDYGAGGSISYTYDSAGNLLSRTTVSAATASMTKRPQAKPKAPDKPKNTEGVTK